MREYLFRGKRVDNGEWVEGYYELGYDSETETPTHYMWVLNHTEKYGEIFVVYPETVGQYTGLTDKNGKKIFEGDILSYVEEIETRSKGKETLKGIYEVRFEFCGFTPLDCLACNHLTVIGNIHDNPELMTRRDE